ncbi:hypothetical protein HZA98_04755 [Candidatus Woesearchaeota archaeon]|nr:hypothetical protein [Candidatus Woesearchaeota archaeon]
MSKTINTKKVSLSLAIVSGIIYVGCVILFAIAPQATLKYSKDLFHGIDITQIAASNISLGSTIIGFIEIIILALLTGWLFAATYNFLQNKRRKK